MTSRTWELVVFDWDGTVMDSTGAIVRAALLAIADLGLAERPPGAIREIIGLGLRESWDSLFPEAGHGDFRDFVAAYRRHFFDRERDSIEPYPGARDVIEALNAQGRLLAVATGKSRRGLDHDFAQSGLGRLFHDSVTADEARSKPHPEMSST
jgi:phosphoglycolate phosphatase